MTAAVIRPHKGGFSLEYAVLIAALGAAVIAMFVYMQRSAAGRMKQNIDAFGHYRLYEEKKD